MPIVIVNMEYLQADAVRAFLSASMGLKASGKKENIQRPRA
jgi:hypothetical protein